MEMIHLRTAKQLPVSIVYFFKTFLEHQNVPTIDGEDRTKLTKSMDYRFFVSYLQSYHIGSGLDAFLTSSISEFRRAFPIGFRNIDHDHYCAQRHLLSASGREQIQKF